jgi:hypothetical protein
LQVFRTTGILKNRGKIDKRVGEMILIPMRTIRK